MNREQMIERLAAMRRDPEIMTLSRREFAGAILDAILPQVTTVEELEALPPRAVVLKDFGHLAQTEEAGSLAHAIRYLGTEFLPTKPMIVVWSPS